MKKFISILFAIFAFAMPAIACESNEIDINGDCIESKFEITTVNMPANTTFKFAMSATGTFYIDWDDGDTDILQRTDTTETLYEHEYTTSGPKTIRMAGKATYYNMNYNASTAVAAIRFGYENPADTTPDLVASINGSIGEIFSSGPNWGQTPTFHFTFARTNITSIPENLFSGVGRVTYGTFRHTFYNCVSLQSIPEGLFKNALGDYYYVFLSTFENCRALTSIPEKLFENRSGFALEFYCTFEGCTGLTSLPEHLFASIKNAQGSMFFRTFYRCTNLTGYIPPSMFAGLIENGSPTADRLWRDTFYGTNLDTTCPAGTTQYTTGYESEWGRVSCIEDAPHVCSAGEYLPKLYNSCTICSSGSACVGGTYNFNTTSDQGIQSCASGTFSPSGSAVCYPHILHVGDSNVYLRSTKQTTPSLNFRIGDDIFYANMTTTRTKMNKDSEHYFHAQWENNHYYVCDDTTCPQ